MKKNEDYAVYVVFSGTPTKMGRFIRTVTHFAYNHVSVALDDSFRELYSFARYRKNAPFYAGFVCESQNRYCVDGKSSKIKVYRIPLGRESYEAVRDRIRAMSENSRDYIYNLPSALCVPIHRRVAAENAYTCVEFAVQLMAKYCTELHINGAEFWSIKALQRYLEPYFLYEGEFVTAQGMDWGSDGFMESASALSDIRDSLSVVSKAVYRACRNGKGGTVNL